MKCRKLIGDIKTGVARSRDEPGGKPAYWPGGVRHGGGASMIQALAGTCEPVAPRSRVARGWWAGL